MGMKVLVADDHRPLRWIVRFHLEDVGCGVVEASSGDEAFALVAREGFESPFDVCLIDCMMFGSSDVGRFRPSAVVVFTGLEEDVAERRLPEADLYLVKGDFGLAELGGRLEAVVASRERSLAKGEGVGT